MDKHKNLITCIVLLFRQIFKPKIVTKDCCLEIPKESIEKVMINKNRSGTKCYYCHGVGRVSEPSYDSFDSGGRISRNYGGLISSPRSMICPICEGTGQLISN